MGEKHPVAYTGQKYVQIWQTHLLFVNKMFANANLTATLTTATAIYRNVGIYSDEMYKVASLAITKRPSNPCWTHYLFASPGA
ncbi:hypothetical protein BBBOND_0403200 [Babesia bigemina]|uniref:Uncharacterized protein n=1 Tax=Babesia bigemina TaxID=5866 RepID=A0A061DCK4_BABBI|nr:hypothetical protein BBBOND_0403200 [Babesia bigemina]CDR97832.1 hypothetical protein BBBOND_0403200 [Babesia bigemina]|eukprot:XP_012770018.1 hypothetical protein BBBOND_0403200 [Babesia bigemina]